jgi:hypothetical protein
MKGFFDRALRAVGEYPEKVEHMHFNPVKAGWVSRPEEEPQTNANRAYATRFP